MHIALFGGSFDPPHIGHQLVANALIEHALVDEVWFVPVFKHPWAKSMNKVKLAPYATRLKMLKQIIGPSQKIAEFKKTSFTYDTFAYFENKHPDWAFTWVMGSEYIPKFNNFLKDHPQLITKPFYVYPREGHSFEGAYSNMTTLKKFPTVKASSTQVRELISSEKSVSKLVNPQVEKIIKDENLYKNTPQ
ncbi:MAG: nicotinate-nicotinamide nucleotide adenylyltransferase [Microgenomates group bacterium]